MSHADICNYVLYYTNIIFCPTSLVQTGCMINYVDYLIIVDD